MHKLSNGGAKHYSAIHAASGGAAHNAILDIVKGEIESLRSDLEQQDQSVAIHRSQGGIAALNKIKFLLENTGRYVAATSQ